MPRSRLARSRVFSARRRYHKRNSLWRYASDAQLLVSRYGRRPTVNSGVIRRLPPECYHLHHDRLVHLQCSRARPRTREWRMGISRVTRASGGALREPGG
jgi:hypothetical protein